MTSLLRAILWLSLLLIAVSGVLSSRDFFMGAVFEHARFGTPSDPPALVVQTNLGYYRKAATIAKSKGADIIVFPEYGVILPGSRTHLKPFLETIPDPKDTRTNPCLQQELYTDRKILLTLSCIARNNSMVVVANIGDIQDCTGQPTCPSDGAFHYNTNVVFDRDGTLLVRYRKEHLFFESGMDLPTEQQTPVFETDFGTFATFICFDSVFGRMSEVARWSSVEGIFFPTMWIDASPQFNSIQYWEAFALGNRVPLLAANIQLPFESAIGSGVFHGTEGALAYTFNPDGVSRLVVSKVPKGAFSRDEMFLNASITAITATSTWDWKDDGKDVPAQCSNDMHVKTSYTCLKEDMDNYTFAEMTMDSGFIEVCNEGMCCSLSYSTKGMEEKYYLGVFNGTKTALNHYPRCEENCFLARCDAQGQLPCSTFPLKSSTLFESVKLTANFSTDFVFPSVLSSGMRLVPHEEWSFTKSKKGWLRSISFKNSDGRSLLSVGLKGRCFDKDPPYVR